MCTKNNNCNFTSCRFNAEGICENEEAREEYVDMSQKVLCLDEKIIVIKGYNESISEALQQMVRNGTFARIGRVCHVGENCEMIDLE